MSDDPQPGPHQLQPPHASPDAPKDNPSRFIPSPTTASETARLTDDTKDNASAPLTPTGAPHLQGPDNSTPELHSPGPSSGTQLPQPSTSGDTKDNPSATSLQQPPSTSGASPSNPEGLRLRSGTILPGPQVPKVSLDKFINFLYTKARESPGLTVPQCDVLNKKLAQVREQRLALSENFKEETERFKEAINSFGGFSRPTALNKETESDNFKVDLSSESVSSASESSASEILLNWLGDSLLESSLDETIHSFCELGNSLPKMHNYSKVAKLMAQLVPLFSGENSRYLSQELQTFLGCCKHAQQCLSDEEQTVFLQILPTRLRGEAYQLFASNVPTSFKEFEERLNRAYLPRETYQELVNKLITTRQLPLEALHTFTSRLKQLLTLCEEAAETKYGPAAAPAVKTQLDDFAKAALKSGVNNPHLCQYLLTLSEASLDALITKALDMERLQQGSLYVQPTLPNPQPINIQQNSATIPPCTSGAVDLSVSQNTIMSPVQNFLPNYPQGIQRTQPLYPATQPSSHTDPQARRIRNFVRPSQGPPQVAPTPTTAASRVKCSFCGNRGHTYDECLKRKNTPFCQKCKTYGHDVRDCRNNRPIYNPGQPRSPPSRAPQDRNNATGPRVYNIRLKCDFCGRKGHSLKTCHQKKKWEERSQVNDSQSTQKSPARL